MNAGDDLDWEPEPEDPNVKVDTDTVFPGAKQAVEMLRTLPQRKVFFYPACGFDWEPLHRFTDSCTVFIYCDWQAQIDQFVQQIEAINHTHGLICNHLENPMLPFLRATEIRG